ncbi:putative glutathione-regulated potassium-efflux system ancillary protein KefG [Vibrio nigripulchritudo SO65]|uniref:NAD(P)H-dependent oxidoreductase n=1 Tax=Vibrio nigripulchritudo TaxID=28173 RepID=UPI0003B1BD7E|nr:NAD(P)H-dependent oxidoreductase [Vibrio nigripulchritudo]CCN35083.1 putative glutathione-regulated potassium-efflux system ancillary protein KefG [Vibrio nigripulchritudo AM115]CCN40772.1 putative glutathione-regulated potassium-efflux system ancillary protein KefG [Vibrio nigripulchritudo FTn2]CCN64419.1 putative glutathione-regulated potassium-efflux system ancillary protein KefG [Vibrio nigripulchritudo POn4]CCN77472.1 putative glutathione-regulated potassium-efflux system ancillary prot
MPQKKVLVLFAHPSHKKSEVNIPLFRAAQHVEGVTLVDLYHEYPRFNINIDREQQRLRDHDIVIFQFPLYWYSTPAILKEWQDLVLEYGFAYGSEGKALHGKYFMCAITAGGTESAYCTDGYNHFTIGELLQPLEQMSSLTGMNYLAPFVLFGSRTAAEEGRIEGHTKRYQELLTALVEDEIDMDKAATASKITNDLLPLLKEKAQ